MAPIPLTSPRATQWSRLAPERRIRDEKDGLDGMEHGGSMDTIYVWMR